MALQKELQKNVQSIESDNQLSLTPSDEIIALWDDIHARLRREFGEAVFRSWLKPLKLQAFYHGIMEVAVPTRFMRDWIQSNYLDRITSLAREAENGVQRVELVVAQIPVAPTENTAPATAASAEPEKALPDALTSLSSPLDTRFTFDGFVVGKTNELAHAAARRIAESQHVPFNPLYLYGGVGLGKTHLMHAIAHRMREFQPNKKIVFLSAERFMFQFVKSLRDKGSMEFKELLRSVDVLMIDDIQFIAGKESTQEEFFHSFNALIDHGKQIVISAGCAPTDLKGFDERLRSRLGWGLVVDLQPATFDLRYGIVAAKAKSLGTDVPASVLEFLAHKITSSVRELEGALNRILAHADLTQRPIDLDMTQDVLSDLLRANDRRVTIDEIQRKVAEHYTLKLADLLSERRARQVARPRQVAMYLCKKLTPRSLPEIGRKFGGRDHTTVMHAVKKIEELMTEDASFKDEVELVRRSLVG